MERKCDFVRRAAARSRRSDAVAKSANAAQIATTQCWSWKQRSTKEAGFSLPQQARWSVRCSCKPTR
eukprot:18396-Heterococcus_DN1.PRE.2